MFLAFLCCGAAAFGADVVSASLDLRQLGMRPVRVTSSLADNSGISFVSDDLLVISIRQWDYAKTAEDDKPTVIVFDINRGSSIATGRIAISRVVGDSVQAISGGRFAVLSDEDLQFCNTDLRCESVEPTPGPLFVSPKGERVAFGGNRRTTQTVIDTESLKRVAEFGHLRNLNPIAIPGDGEMLMDEDDRIIVQKPGAANVYLKIDSLGFREFRFLGSESVACLDDHAAEVVIYGTDGKETRRYKVATSWKTGFLPTASGTRFGIYEHGYTRLNSVVNFLDIDEGRPENFQRVRVIDMSTWDEISRFEWDPKGYEVTPAISPDGHHVARVRGGVLEVLDVK